METSFETLTLTIGVDVSILSEDSQSLLRNTDMIENGLDISLQGRYCMLIYFLVY